MPIDSQVVDQLGSDDPEQRKAAIVALVRSADAEALPLLVKLYRTDPDPALRELARKAGRRIKAQIQHPAPPPTIPEVVDVADQAIPTFTEDETPKPVEKAPARVRKMRKISLRWLLVGFVIVALAGVAIFFVASGALERYLQAEKINGWKQTVHHSDGLDYYLLVPDGTPPKKGWPVLLVLHDSGGSGLDVFSLFADFAAREGVVLIAPTFGDYPYPEDQHVAPPLDKLIANVGKAYPLNPFGAVVYGFSAGGEAATLFAGLYPNRVAGVTVEDAPEIYPPPSSRGLPYNILYGENDDVRSYASESVSRVQRLGYPLNFEIVPGAGHTITQRGLDLAMDMVRTVYP